MASPWTSIDAWLGQHSPELLATLRPPMADSKPIKTLEARIECTLPAGVIDFWRHHDGAKGSTTILCLAEANSWVRGFELFSADEARKRHWAMRDLGVGWLLRDIPIGEDGGGNVLLVEAQTGQVFTWDHETIERIAVFATFQSWIQDIADAMRDGIIESDDESNFGVRRRAPGEVRAKSVLLDYPARALLCWMKERDLVSLSDDANEGELVVALQHALNTSASALIDVLDTHPAIEDCFIDDETIAALAKEFG